MKNVTHQRFIIAKHSSSYMICFSFGIPAFWLYSFWAFGCWALYLVSATSIIIIFFLYKRVPFKKKNETNDPICMNHHATIHSNRITLLKYKQTNSPTHNSTKEIFIFLDWDVLNDYATIGILYRMKHKAKKTKFIPK